MMGIYASLFFPFFFSQAPGTISFNNASYSKGIQERMNC